MAQSILTNTAVAAIGRAVNVALGIIAVSLMSRLLGTSAFGTYTTIVAIATVLQIAGDLGLYLTLTRAIAQHPERENFYLGHIMSLRLIILVVLFGAGGAALQRLWPAPGLIAAYGLVAVGCGVQSISQLFMGIYQKYSLVWRATVGDIVGRLTQVIGIVFASSVASITVMAGLFAASSAAAATLHYRLLPAPVNVRLKFSWSTWRHLLEDAVPLGTLLLLNAIYFRVDIILLSFFRLSEQAGLYGVAYRLIESALFLPAMFGGLLLPRMSAAWQRGEREVIQRYLTQGLFTAAWAAAFIIPSLIMLAHPIILLIAGPDFEQAAPLLQILSVALAVMFAGNIFGFALVACHQQRSLLKLAAALVVFNLLLNILLIPRFGALSAAWITVATEVIAAGTAAYLSHRLVRLTMPRQLVTRLPLVIVATLLTYYALPAGWPVLVTLTVGAGVFLLGSWWLRLLGRENISMLIAAS